MKISDIVSYLHDGTYKYIYMKSNPIWYYHLSGKQIIAKSIALKKQVQWAPTIEELIADDWEEYVIENGNVIDNNDGNC